MYQKEAGYPGSKVISEPKFLYRHEIFQETSLLLISFHDKDHIPNVNNQTENYSFNKFLLCSGHYFSFKWSVAKQK